ncbi:MAG: tyrosine-type recombinase/integrase [Lachnospiraceae bacterium]|nr:tyrosine-type recombinase/integrase [Lachnospiraceae bacterium]
MKMPNGYGSVIKLSGKRRKPWAVRISYMEELPDGTVKRKRKYLAYFVKQESALQYLTEYNNGSVVPEHLKFSEVPTFAELYEKWKKYKKSLKDKLSDSTWKNYEIAFTHLAPLHESKITSIRAIDMQDCLNSHNHQSKSTIGNMRALLKGVYAYAIMNEYIEQDITQYLKFEYTASSTSIHSRFSDEEINTLWKQLYVINNVDIVLIYIYTGMRPTELLEVLTENVHLDERYMVGGLKTENGYNRLIPLCDKVLPLIRNRYNPDKKYLINNKYGNHYTYGTYQNGNWNTVMGKLGFQHSPHDGRYTFASLADNVGMNPVCLKIIMGHSVSDVEKQNFKTRTGLDITKGVYTQKTMEELLNEVNKL